MFPMTAKIIMTEEAYRRFAWINFWHKKNGIFSLIFPEIVVLICAAIYFYIGKPLAGVVFLLIIAVLPFLYYLSMNRNIKKYYRGNPLWHDLEQEFSFYETDFRVVNRNNNSRFEYKDIVAIIDKPETFYIMVGRSMGLILDKADCQPELIEFLLKLKENRSL